MSQILLVDFSLETHKETPLWSNLIAPWGGVKVCLTLFHVWFSQQNCWRLDPCPKMGVEVPQQRTTHSKFLLQWCVAFLWYPFGVSSYPFLPPLGLLFMFEALEEEQPRRGGEWLSGYTWHRRPSGTPGYCVERSARVKSSLLLGVGRSTAKIHSQGLQPKPTWMEGTLWGFLCVLHHCRGDLNSSVLPWLHCCVSFASLLLYFETDEGNLEPDTGP